MKKRMIGFGWMLLITLLGCQGVLAQEGIVWRGSGGWGAGLPYNRLFDPAAVQTLEGEVVRVEKLTPLEGMSDGVQLILKVKGAKGESVSIHLGPMWFLERQDFPVSRGDLIEVSGSRVRFDGKPAVIAGQVNKDGKVLLLREKNGFPAWSGWRRR